MQTQLAKVIEELQRQAKVCETVAQDKTEEALTGASTDKEKNEQEAREWMAKSKVWIEAEAVVRGFLQPTTPAEHGIAFPPSHPAPCI